MAELYYKQLEFYKGIIGKCLSSYASDAYENSLEELGKAIKDGAVNKDEHLTVDSAFRIYLREMFLALPQDNKKLMKDGDIAKLLNISLDVGSKIFPLPIKVKQVEESMKSADDPKIKGEFREEYRKMSVIMSIAKTPFQMLEDILEQQTVSQSAHTWEIVQSLTSKLSKDSYFQKGKLQLLKICNGLLKKLSKAIHTEFCGKVLMFLSSVYGTSEKSAVNLGGKINDANNTLFETNVSSFQEAFEPEVLRKFELAYEAEQNSDQLKTKMVKSSSSSTIKEEGEADGEEEQEATGDAKCKTHETDEVENEKMGSYTTTKYTKTGKNLQIDHELYQTFWGFQKHFTSDNKSLDSKEKWKALTKQIDVILSAFECFEYPKKELQQSAEQFLASRRNALQASVSEFMIDPKSSSHSNGSSDVNIDSFTSTTDIAEDTGCKFLTSPQLFALQLLDPALRKQILTQILIFMHSLRACPISIVESAQPRKFGHKDNKDDRKDKFVHIQEDIKQIETRAFALLGSAPSDGAGFIKGLKRLLDRELSWLEWKKMRKCLEFELYPPTNRGAFDADTLSSISRKTPPLRALSSKISEPAQYITSISNDDVSTAAKMLTENAPTYEKHIEFWMDCEDPDAGIEDEYHPKHDTIYCWRARRLLANHKLKVFEKMMDGSLRNGIGELTYPSQRSHFIELLGPEIPEPEPEISKKRTENSDSKLEIRNNDSSQMMEVDDTGVSEAKMEMEEGEAEQVEAQTEKEVEEAAEDDIEPAQKKQRTDGEKMDRKKHNNKKRKDHGNKDIQREKSAEKREENMKVDETNERNEGDYVTDNNDGNAGAGASGSGGNKKKARGRR